MHIQLLKSRFQLSYDESIYCKYYSLLRKLKQEIHPYYTLTM